MIETVVEQQGSWQLQGAKKDRQSITADWQFTNRAAIAGVQVLEVRHVPKDNGCLTEILRREWLDGTDVIDQIFQVVLHPGGVSAWHAHEVTTDRLFCTYGNLKLVLFDARQNSPTHGRVTEIRMGALRPMLVVVPPGVWHGVQNYTTEPAFLLNAVDKGYTYEDPDHWRLPADSPEVPYRFT